MEDKKSLRILIKRDASGFVGQCLEYDICTQGATEQELKERMSCLIEVELAHAAKNNLDIDPAPKEFNKMWEQVSAKEFGGHQYGELKAA